MDLPDSWQTVELTQDSEAVALRASPPLQAVMNTFDALVADTELLLLGAEDTAVFASGSPVFVLVAQSQRLQRLSPENIVSYAEEHLPENVTIVEASTTESLTNELKGNLLINIEQGGQTWRCREQFIPDESGTYLVATCTTFTQFPAQLADFAIILRSFQSLRS